jgi:hypothetical protein
LYDLKALDLAVPDGFVVTTTAYRNAVVGAGLDTTLVEILSGTGKRGRRAFDDPLLGKLVHAAGYWLPHPGACRTGDVAMAVVVQRMVPAVAAGVAMTLDTSKENYHTAGQRWFLWWRDPRRSSCWRGSAVVSSVIPVRSVAS